MICNTCGRQTQNETANFCEYCGASFREQTQGTQNPGFGQPPYNRSMMQGPMNNPMNNPMGAPYAQPMQQSGADKPVSFLNWLGSYALLMVPFLNIIMLFIWAFSYNTPVSKRNWARVTLIVGAIVFLLFILYTGYLMSTPIYQQMYLRMMEQYGYSVK